MKNFIKIYVFLFLSFSSISSIQAQDSSNYNIGSPNKIDLEINLKPASSYRLSNTATQKITQDVIGRSLEIVHKIDYTVQFDVISNDGIKTKIKAAYEKINIENLMPQEDLIFDSESENDDSLSTIYTLLNQPFFIYLDNRKGVEKVEGLENINTVINDKNQSLIALFNEHNLAKTLEATLYIYPDYSIGLGDNWTKGGKGHLNNQFELTYIDTFTLESLNEDLAWINMDGKIVNTSDQGNDIGEISINGTQYGTFEVDRLSGLTLSNDIHREMEGVLKTEGQDIPIRMISDSATRIEKL